MEQWGHPDHLSVSGQPQWFSLPVSRVQVRLHLVQAARDAVQLLALVVQDSGSILQSLLETGHQTSQLLPLGHGGGGAPD